MRKGYLSFYQLGALNALCECVRVAEEITGKKGANVENFIYNSLFQSGIDKFVLPSKEEKYLPKSSLARNRLGFIKEEKTKKPYEKVKKVFDEMLPEGYFQNREYDGVFAIQLFISDLLICMNHGYSYISVLRKPLIDSDLRDKLPADFSLAFNNLMGCFEVKNASLVAPSNIIEYDHIKRFDEILQSKSFSSYRDAHLELEVTNVDKKKVIFDIYQKGKSLVKENADLLRLKKTTVSLLSVTPREA